MYCLKVEDKYMKSKIILSICMIGMVFVMTACQNNEVVENLEVEEELVVSPTCEILVSSDFICEKPVKAGIYTEHAQWEKAVEGTDIEEVLERKDMYGEAFFEEKALIYLVDCSSGGAGFEYEGYKIEDKEGSKKITIQILGSTEHLLNTLHTYHIFFVVDKNDAKKIDEAELSKSWRD